MSNIKIHFAGCDNGVSALCALKAAGVNYRLFTAYPFIKSKSSSTGDFRVSTLYEAQAKFTHTIVDSGLFTMMFGADSQTKKTPEDIREWMHRIVRFANDNEIANASYVECDCQKLISPQFAWELRREMKSLMPGKEIINVFHLEDGKDGFDQLVDFSDYIAISVPELRIAMPKTYRQATCAFAKRAKMLKPKIKIHLLGCTEQYLIEKNRFCTSADSSSWTSPMRFGYCKGNHIRHLTKNTINDGVAIVKQASSHLGFPLTDRASVDSSKRYITAKIFLQDYERWGGSQT